VSGELATSAFVLRTRPFGESDRIVTFITEQHGKLAGIAKGAKNSRRRFGGTLEPFLRIRVVFQQRTSSDLVFLLRCELVGELRAFTRDLDRFAAGSYVLELTDRMVFGRESGRDVYRLVQDALTLLDAGAPCDPLLRAFEMHLLTASGYAPVLDRCRSCARPIGDDPAVFIALEREGLLCRSCVRSGERVRPVATTAADALARLAASPLASAATVVDASAAADAATITEQLVAAVTGGSGHARRFMARARVDSPGGVR